MKTLPIIVIGAGPVGLAAASHLLERGLSPLVLEAGPSAAHAVSQWSHVRIFSPWRHNMDAAARRLLETTGWSAPALDELPTGGELVERYLKPLAAHPKLVSRIRYGARVIAVGRRNTDKVRTDGREQQPFVVRVAIPGSEQHEEIEGQAVIDASGTWSNPNPIGSGGYPAKGEIEHRDRIAYGIPDVLGKARNTYANTTVAVAGTGHSAINTVLDLLKLREQEPDTSIIWIMRRDNLTSVYGGGENDALPARGRLGQKAQEAIHGGAVRLLAPFRVSRIDRREDQLELTGENGSGSSEIIRVDRLVVAAGFRPDLEILRELRTSLDPLLESTASLGPLIDPNVHSCGTVRPHGAKELAHPEKDFYIVGMKSYGRAPTFLMTTGYEQVRSVVAELAGDHEAAARVQLNLPETGVCGLPDTVSEEPEEEGCCGGTPTPGADACCKLDEEKKAAGENGCGCSDQPADEYAAEPAREPVCCG
jgi:thioredoxin reductase